MFDTMQPPHSGDANDREVEAMTAAGYAPDRVLMGSPQWFNDYHPLDVLRAGYALAVREIPNTEHPAADDKVTAPQVTTNPTGPGVVIASDEVLRAAIESLTDQYTFTRGGLGELTDRDVDSIVFAAWNYLAQHARETGEQQ